MWALTTVVSLSEVGTNNGSLIVRRGHEQRQSHCQRWARTTAVSLSEVAPTRADRYHNNSWDFSAAHYVYRSFIAYRFLI